MSQESSNWLVFQLTELLQHVEPGKLRFHEFLRTQSLSCAIYHLPAGSKEMASAHEEDELYFVLEGRGQLRIGDDAHACSRALYSMYMPPATTPSSTSSMT